MVKKVQLPWVVLYYMRFFLDTRTKPLLCIGRPEISQLSFIKLTYMGQIEVTCFNEHIHLIHSFHLFFPSRSIRNPMLKEMHFLLLQQLCPTLAQLLIQSKRYYP